MRIRIPKALFAALLAMGVGSTAQAQQDFYNHCNALLQHGANNISYELNEQSVEAFKWHRYCRTDISERSDRDVFEAEASIFGYGNGSGGRNVTSARRSVSNWCDDKKDIYQAYRQTVQQAQTVSQDAMNAWNECQSIARKGVIISPTIGGAPARFADFTIDSTFDGDLYFLGISSPGWTCQIKLVQRDGTTKNLPEYALGTNAEAPPESRAPILLRNDNIQVNCQRDAPVVSEVDGVGHIAYAASNISINTSSVRMSLFFDEEPDTYFVTPPKSVLAFNSNECPRGWTEFEPAYGRFIRGIDKGETPTDPQRPNGNPRTAGHQQEDTIGRHAHKQMYDWVTGHFSRSGHEAVPFVTGRSNHGKRTEFEGEDETRPKNVALLYCERSERLGRLRAETELLDRTSN